MIRTLVAVAVVGGVMTACAPERQVSGRALYNDHCVSCHGPVGRGDGVAAAGLARPPADLTRISERNGGAFPMVEVMSTIDGYTRRGERDLIMPELGVALQEGPLVMLDTGGGVMTPTPANLVALANYLKRLQN